MEGQEQERALASGVKHDVRVTSSVSHLLIFSLTLGLPLLARIWSPRTHRSLLCLPPKPQSHSKKLAFPRGSTTSSSTAPSFLPLSHIWVVKEILGIVQHPSCVAKFVLSLGIQAKLLMRCIGKSTAHRQLAICYRICFRGTYNDIHIRESE